LICVAQSVFEEPFLPLNVVFSRDEALQVRNRTIQWLIMKTPDNRV